MTTAEWLAGATKGPKMISLEKGFAAAPIKEFVTSGTNAESPSGHYKELSEKEMKIEFLALKRENQELKQAVGSKDARIRQLEAQMAAMSSS
jgi:hypothetical protein